MTARPHGSRHAFAHAISKTSAANANATTPANRTCAGEAASSAAFSGRSLGISVIVRPAPSARSLTQPALCARLHALDREDRQPQLGCECGQACAREQRTRHAHDRERLPVHADLPSDHTWDPTEALHPRHV